MNESEFENELRALRPVNPAPEIEQAIERELRHHSQLAELSADRWGGLARPRESLASRILTGLCWAAGGAAIAALAFMFLPDLRNGSHPVTPPAGAGARQDGYQETTASTEWIDTEDGGLLYDKDQQPEEVLRYSSVEHRSWENPATGARVEVEVPREDVVLVPVSFQ